MQFSRRSEPLRLIATRLGLPVVETIMRAATVNEALRITVYYHDERAPDSVATLKRGHGSACQLEVVYDKSPRRAMLHYDIPVERYRKLLGALRRAKFDRLDDEEDLPYTGVDWWLIERAAGSFYHDIALCPTSARGHHREVVLALREHLSEAVHQGV
ncbi:MAG: hypothetical protein GYB66_00560 [Chloroflexi bacterium]|nr:hypothetical protein [Chloroflexota bacterium]